MKLTEKLLDQLRNTVAGHASAIRIKTTLVPFHDGEKVFPPTYAVDEKAPHQYAEEKRRINGEMVDCVLLDSVQSQANRLELSLLNAMRAGECPLPVLRVRVGDKEITALDAPHRVFDAYFRDSYYEGTPFRESALGKRAVNSSLSNATGLYQICPTALLFGVWDSHSFELGGMGYKYPRAFTSEIIGINAEVGKRTSSRLDPVIGRAAEIPMERRPDGTIGILPAGTKNKMKPSELGYGNIAPSIESGGVTIERAEQIAVLSFPQLRRLGFPHPITGERTAALDVAGRTVLAAMALYGMALQQAEGFWLRSRCHLLPATSPTWEIVGSTAESVTPFTLSLMEAKALYMAAVAAAKAEGLTWHEGFVDLAPGDGLVSLVNASRLLTEAAE
jgi:CRISPR-associated protein Csb1